MGNMAARRVVEGMSGLRLGRVGRISTVEKVFLLYGDGQRLDMQHHRLHRPPFSVKVCRRHGQTLLPVQAGSAALRVSDVAREMGAVFASLHAVFITNKFSINARKYRVVESSVCYIFKTISFENSVRTVC